MQATDIRYSEDEKRLYLSEAHYIEPIEKEVYEYAIGGYQVIERFLKDRQGETLGLEECETLIQIIGIVSETMKIAEEIDGVYDGVEKELFTLPEENVRNLTDF